jgi:hypothetical protein
LKATSKATSTLRSRDRQLVSHLSDLDPQDRAQALKQLAADEALRDIGADLTIQRIRDVLDYAATTKLAQQIRAGMARALEGGDKGTDARLPLEPTERAE